MKRKRLLCAVLALVLLLSAQPAAASNRRSTVINAACRLPVINVFIPSTGTVYLNPYKMSVSIHGQSDDRQIVSSRGRVYSKSDIPLNMDVTVTGEIKSGSTMTLAASPTGEAGTTKSAFIFFEIHQADDPDFDLVDWDTEYDAAKHIVVTDGVPITKKSIMTLPAMTMDKEVAPGGYALFRLSGDAVRQPTDAWTSNDGLTVTVAFTFTPIPYV